MGTMPEGIEFVSIRRLPDGGRRNVQIVSRAPGRLSLAPVDNEPNPAFDAGALVEIDGPQTIYLGEVIGRQKDSLVTVAVEHFIDRGALAEIEKVWRTAEGA